MLLCTADPPVLMDEVFLCWTVFHLPALPSLHLFTRSTPMITSTATISTTHTARPAMIPNIDDRLCDTGATLPADVTVGGGVVRGECVDVSNGDNVLVLPSTPA